MEKRISYFLGQNGYLKMLTTLSEFTIFFKRESGFVSMVELINMDKNPYVTKESVKDVRQRAIWRFKDQGIDEVHPLVLCISSDMERAISVGEDEQFFWVIDKENNQLVIPEGKVEDFYGMKAMVESWLTADFDESMQTESGAYQAGGRQVKSFMDLPFVNHGIFCINMIAFTFCTLMGEVLYNYGRLSLSEVLAGDEYRLISYMFFHADMSHLAGNMIILFFLGEILEREMGHIKYFITYFGAGIIGGLASLYMQSQQMALGTPVAGSIGASGAIFGMLGGLLWVLLRNKGRLAGMTAMRILFLICYTLYCGLTGIRVDNAAHIGGLIGGIIFTVILYRKKRSGQKQQEREGSR